MKRRLTTLDEYFSRAMENPELRRAYREVLDEELGETLRYLREERGLTQNELAELMGYANRSRISQIEGAEGLKLNLETIARYANTLGYRLDINFVDTHSGEVSARYFLSDVDTVAGEQSWNLEGLDFGLEWPEDSVEDVAPGSIEMAA